LSAASPGGDRAEAFERAFERCGARSTRSPAVRRAYLLLFYGDPPAKAPPAGSFRAGMPLWIANGTDAGTGGRLLTAALPAGRTWPFAPRPMRCRCCGATCRSRPRSKHLALPYLEPSGELLRLNPGPPRALKDRLCDQVRSAGRLDRRSSTAAISRTRAC
jgi:hypothetical protein